ncbi:hypothetical protein QYS49_32310 [Marivirga salinae]|uniref:Uncharacterized protein n=1 Tax=Marivirga salinarum TaxID=3059078 RepID=A0AA51R9C0_9BACT|nr:hypothetical protein [Marivirga sp. BDSF4-3]WMN12077.1 hypothetical protein QYS49_32310 [Marivirga sp. BDSF4-3]
MNKYNEKRLRIMKILNQRQEQISKIEIGLNDLHNDVKLLKKDFKDGMDSLAECFFDSGKIKSTIDKKFNKK